MNCRVPPFARLCRARTVLTGLLLAVALTVGHAAPASTAAGLTVTVTGLRSSKGTVHIALYDRADTFPDSDGMLKEVTVPVADRRAEWLFSGIPAGTYAVAVYHDENGNDEFDQGFLGIPLEDYGFSNGATAFLGPPSFASAAITVPATGRRIVIDLKSGG